jgi:hypothetical protein
VAKNYTDNSSEVEYFDENNKEAGDSVFSVMQLETKY